jgi:hypothetical protein
MSSLVRTKRIGRREKFVALGIPKILHFQVTGDSMYVLDAEGTLWKNPYLNQAGKWIEGWTPIAGPSRAEHRLEESKTRERYQHCS